MSSKIHVGPKGGHYYLRKNQKGIMTKVYIKKKPISKKKTPIKKNQKNKTSQTNQINQITKPRLIIDILTDTDYEKYMDGKLSKARIDSYIRTSDKLTKILVKLGVVDTDGNIHDESKYKKAVANVRRVIKSK